MMELCDLIGVPSEVTASSRRADPDCGRPARMAEIPLELIDTFLQVQQGLLPRSELSKLTTGQRRYLTRVLKLNQFKRLLPTRGPSLNLTKGTNYVGSSQILGTDCRDHSAGDAGFLVCIGSYQLTHAAVVALMSFAVCAKVDDLDKSTVIERWSNIGGRDAGQMSRLRLFLQGAFTFLACQFVGFAVVATETHHQGNLWSGVAFGLYIFTLYYGYMYIFDRARFEGRVEMEQIIAKPLSALGSALNLVERNNGTSHFAELSVIESKLNVVAQLLQLPASATLSEQTVSMARRYAQRAAAAFEAAAANDQRSGRILPANRCHHPRALPCRHHRQWLTDKFPQRADLKKLGGLVRTIAARPRFFCEQSRMVLTC